MFSVIVLRLRVHGALHDVCVIFAPRVCVLRLVDVARVAV